MFLACACASVTPSSKPAPTTAGFGSPAVTAAAQEPSASSAPAVPGLTPVPGASGITPISIPGVKDDLPLQLFDAASLGFGVRPATPDEQARGDRSINDVTDTGTTVVGPSEALLSWAAGVCETGWRVVVDSSKHVTIAGLPRKPCDLARHTYHVVLTLPSGIDPAEVNVSMDPPTLLE
jgi:hypothetical protein